MTTTTLTPVLVQHFVDNNGNALYLGQLSSFAAGTNTPLATYTDSTGGTPNPNPVILNPRGEASVWIPPNVAYKFNLTDANGNQIPGFPIDNVVNAQLVTLYGGVDTGVANAYILNFAAPYSVLSDGITIFWVPSNTNTGPSTLNVNGLGVISILNPDASALTASEIVASGIVGVVYRGGNFYLISSALSIPRTGTFFMIATGVTAAGNTAAWSITNNNLVSLRIPYINGNSSGVGFTLTGLPAAIQPANNTTFTIPVAQDNSSLTSAVGQIGPFSAGVIILTKGFAGTGGNNWTNAGVKGVGQLLGGITQVGNTVLYSLV